MILATFLFPQGFGNFAFFFFFFWKHHVLFVRFVSKWKTRLPRTKLTSEKQENPSRRKKVQGGRDWQKRERAPEEQTQNAHDLRVMTSLQTCPNREGKL